RMTDLGPPFHPWSRGGSPSIHRVAQFPDCAVNRCLSVWLAIAPLIDNPAVLERPAPALASVIRPSAADIQLGRRRLHANAAGSVALVLVAYWGLVFSPVGWIGRIGFAGLLVVGVVAVSTGILHDANHGAFSASRRANRVVAYSA